ncbi:hypothetical protein FOZ62_001136 [Perkinsus olseni]|uniref:Secreted protein n=1 Tax=Perkinsus olseni TaxID=32597 RepID=A0A7J6SEL3_PEROL|nr:hypothetical protein FOZ62_001136 [Perkinsus olseni]
MIGTLLSVCVIVIVTFGDASPPTTPAWPVRDLDASNGPTRWPVEGLIGEQLAAEDAAGEDPLLSPGSATATITQTSATSAPTNGAENGSTVDRQWDTRGEWEMRAPVARSFATHFILTRSPSSCWQPAGGRRGKVWLALATVEAALLV